MRVVTSQAEQVCQHLSANEEVAQIDIVIIITIITAIIQLFMQCNRTEQSALDSMKNPGIFHRWMLRRVVNDALEDETKAYTREVTAAVAAVGRTLTLSKVRNMFTEVRA